MKHNQSVKKSFIKTYSINFINFFFNFIQFQRLMNQLRNRRQHQIIPVIKMAMAIIHQMIQIH